MWSRLVDTYAVKGLEKLTSIRLAEVLTQRGSVENEAITDALYAQDRQGDKFVDVLVASGNITEWDLAKVVAEHFQLPFIMASSYEIEQNARDLFPKELLFEHKIVPLDVFGDVATVVLPILTPCEILQRLQDAAKVELFPYVGLTSENTRILGDLFSDFQDWTREHDEKREAAARARAGGDKKSAGDWMDIFDSADASVRGDLKSDD